MIEEIKLMEEAIVDTDIAYGVWISRVGGYFRVTKEMPKSYVKGLEAGMVKRLAVPCPECKTNEHLFWNGERHALICDGCESYDLSSDDETVCNNGYESREECLVTALGEWNCGPERGQ